MNRCVYSPKSTRSTVHCSRQRLVTQPHQRTAPQPRQQPTGTPPLLVGYPSVLHGIPFGKPIGVHLATAAGLLQRCCQVTCQGQGCLTLLVSILLPAAAAAVQEITSSQPPRAPHTCTSHAKNDMWWLREHRLATREPTLWQPLLTHVTATAPPAAS